ncbi:MAG: hypothetical protein CMJ11_07985 [Pelagibacterales bacterium]|nr:hypothetical protein [Pelagibacterales bacterium]|tara:strand:+ start:123 stop:359 length:237 start_codon:yes stop_codon:yes gene_type:complete
MTNIIKMKTGAWANPKIIAKGNVSSVKKMGAFYVFTIKLDSNDIREYSFTSSNKAEHMRKIMIGHLEEKFRKELKSYK